MSTVFCINSKYNADRRPNRAFSALFCETSGVLCDHKLFIGGDDKDFNLAAGLGNFNIFAARAIAVSSKIDFNAEVIKAVQDALTHSLVVFADAAVNTIAQRR